MSAASTQQVVAWAREGREDAYRELVRRFRRPVFERLNRKVRDSELAEDLTQVTFVKAFAALRGSHGPVRNPSAWIQTIAHHTAVDYIKRKRPDSTNSPSAVTPTHIDARAMYVPTPDNGTPRPDARQFAAELAEAIKRLKPVHRRCFILRHVEHRSYDSIAEIMHVPVGTAKSHVRRARKQLKGTLGPLLDS
jgi:RNA polymerase sigma factor (sigma-70 family)